MNSRKIFFDRLIRGWKYQYGVIRSIADWTIILYLIIPANLIFIFMYRSWWMNTPSWIEFISLPLLFFVIFLFSWSGTIRTYVQEADKIFLIKKSKIFLGVRRYGYFYSLVLQLLLTGITFLILLPFLRNHYLLEWHQIISMMFYFMVLHTTTMLVKFYLKKIDSKLIKIMVGSFVFLGLGFISLIIYKFFEQGILSLIYLIGFIMLTVSFLQSLRVIKSVSSIEHDIEMEQEQKMKYIEMIFSLSYEIEKPVVSKRKKPLLYRRSKRIFNNRTEINGFIELFIKVFIRNSSYLRGFIQIISVTSAAIIIIPPIWIKAIIFIGYLIMMHTWLSLVWDKITSSNPLSKKYCETSEYFSARKRAVLSFFIVATLILVLFVTIGLSVLKLINGLFISNF